MTAAKTLWRAESLQTAAEELRGRLPVHRGARGAQCPAAVMTRDIFILFNKKSCNN